MEKEYYSLGSGEKNLLGSIEGENIYYGYVRDYAGNYNICQTGIRRDITPPKCPTSFSNMLNVLDLDLGCTRGEYTYYKNYYKITNFSKDTDRFKFYYFDYNFDYDDPHFEYNEDQIRHIEGNRILYPHVDSRAGAQICLTSSDAYKDNNIYNRIYNNHLKSIV